MYLKNEFKPGTLHYVVQRGYDGSPCFSGEDDYLVYLDCLADAAARHHCAVHAYVLMPDHVRLLLSPEAGHLLAPMMRGVGGRYVEYVRYVHQRSGVLWKQGVESTPVVGERDLAFHRSIESAPVQACLAASAADYRWSSYRHHAHGCADPVIHDHPSYLKLGATRRERQLAYRELARKPADIRVTVAAEGRVSSGIAPHMDRLKQDIARLMPRARPGMGARAGTLAYAAAAV